MLCCAITCAATFQSLQACTHCSILTTTISWLSSFSKVDDTFLRREERPSSSHQHSGGFNEQINTVLGTMMWDMQAHDTWLSMHSILLDQFKSQYMASHSDSLPKQICILEINFYVFPAIMFLGYCTFLVRFLEKCNKRRPDTKKFSFEMVLTMIFQCKVYRKCLIWMTRSIFGSIMQPVKLLTCGKNRVMC